MRTGAARCAAGALLTFCAADGAVAWAAAKPAHVQAAAPAQVASAADALPIPVTLGAPVRTPELQHPNEINAALQGARAALAHCFEVPAASAESAVGQFQLTLALDAQGKVIQGTGGAEYSTRNPLVAGCVLDTLAELSFPAGPWDHPLQLVFAAELQGQGADRALVLHLPELGAKAEVSTGASPSQGPDGAPVTIVEYTDYECGFCARADSTLHQVMQAYPGQIRWVVKQRPLHAHSRLAAKAALAAQAQGKFWPMHDALMKSYASLDRTSIEGIAKQQGLDLARFDAALDGDALEPALQADWFEADRAAVKAVPAFVINGHVLTGAQPLAEFKKAVDAALAGKPLAPEQLPSEVAPTSLDGLQVTTLDGARQPLAQLGAKVTVLSFITSMLPDQSTPNPELQELADSFAGDAEVRFLIVDVDPESASARDAVRQQLAREGVRVPVVFEPGALLRYVNAHMERPATMPANQMIVPGLVMVRELSQVIVPHGTSTAALHAEIEAQR